MSEERIFSLAPESAVTHTIITLRFENSRSAVAKPQFCSGGLFHSHQQPLPRFIAKRAHSSMPGLAHPICNSAAFPGEVLSITPLQNSRKDRTP